MLCFFGILSLYVPRRANKKKTLNCKIPNLQIMSSHTCIFTNHTTPYLPHLLHSTYTYYFIKSLRAFNSKILQLHFQGTIDLFPRCPLVASHRYRCHPPIPDNSNNNVSFFLYVAIQKNYTPQHYPFSP